MLWDGTGVAGVAGFPGSGGLGVGRGLPLGEGVGVTLVVAPGDCEAVGVGVAVGLTHVTRRTTWASMRKRLREVLWKAAP